MLTTLSEMHDYYKRRQKLYYFPLLDFLVTNKKTFIEFPESPILDTLLETYALDRYTRYMDYKNFERISHERQHEEIMRELPENLIIPTPHSSDTYQSIVVDISDQRLYAFADGVLIASSSITSGRKGFGTVRGDFSVKKKQTQRIISSPFTDPKHQYRLHVDYWIQFHKSFGIHDACNSKNCWRKKFGTPDYLANGSHGCVNTPYEFMGWLYDWSLPGTRVSIVQ